MGRRCVAKRCSPLNSFVRSRCIGGAHSACLGIDNCLRLDPVGSFAFADHVGNALDSSHRKRC